MACYRPYRRNTPEMDILDASRLWNTCGYQAEKTSGHRCLRISLFTVLLGLIYFATPALGQVEPSGISGLSLTTGSTFSWAYLQYGAHKEAGLAAFAGLDSSHHWGIEGAARWLVFNRTDGVQAATYLIGPRYHINVRRHLEPYAKAEVGRGLFTFASGAGTGSYFVVAPGGGVDYVKSRRLHIRVADVEYQSWLGFPNGNMSSVVISSGFSYRIF